MTVQLYEGCWGVTRGGEDAPPEVVKIGKRYDGRRQSETLVSGRYIGQWFDNGSADMFETTEKNSRFDIIAVFATEADAFLAGEGAMHPTAAGYAKLAERLADACKDVPPAPKPVTWPDGVEFVRIGPQSIAVGVLSRQVIVDCPGAGGSTPEQARQLAALILAAADYVEGRG